MSRSTSDVYRYVCGVILGLGLTVGVAGAHAQLVETTEPDVTSTTSTGDVVATTSDDTSVQSTESNTTSTVSTGDVTATTNTEPSVEDETQPSAGLKNSSVTYDCGLIYDNDLRILCSATDSAKSILKDRDKNGLITKIIAADNKLYLQKYCDTVAKLEDYEDKVYALDNAPKSKISDEDANCLLDGVGASCETVGVRQIILRLDPNCISL